MTFGLRENSNNNRKSAALGVRINRQVRDWSEAQRLRRPHMASSKDMGCWTWQVRDIGMLLSHTAPAFVKRGRLVNSPAFTWVSTWYQRWYCRRGVVLDETVLCF